MTLEEKLELFKNSAIDEATAKSRSLLDEHENNLKRVFDTQIQRAKQKADDKIKAKSDDLMRSHNKQLSREYNNIKRELGEKHHAVKERLFADVKKRLIEYTKTEAYENKLISQILEAKRFAKSEPITIYVDPIDADRVPHLEAATNLAVTVSKTPFIGGMRAVINSKNILIDHSFAARLEEASEDFTI